MGDMMIDTVVEETVTQSLSIEDIEAMRVVEPEPERFAGDPAATWDYWNPWDLAVITEEDIWERLRNRRNQLLAACDYRMVTDAPWDTAPWEAYRQALRDLPDTTSDPRRAAWPTSP